MSFFVRYDGHAVSLWWKSTKGVVADEPKSDSQGSYREVRARRRDSEIVAWRTGTWYKGLWGWQSWMARMFQLRKKSKRAPWPISMILTITWRKFSIQRQEARWKAWSSAITTINGWQAYGRIPEKFWIRKCGIIPMEMTVFCCR